jgi:hypothetical protein
MAKLFATGLQIQKDGVPIINSPKAINFTGSDSTAAEDPTGVAKIGVGFALPYQQSYYLEDAGSANAISVTIPATPALTSWTQLVGTRLNIKVAASNTGATTIVVYGIAGAKTVKKFVTTDLVLGNLITGGIYEFIYDGTNVQVISKLAGTEIVDLYSESNYAYPITLFASSRIQCGQSFIGNGDKLTSMKFFLSKTGSPTGLAYGVLWTHSGVYGTSSVGTTPQLALSNSFDVSTLTGVNQLIEFTFPTNYATVNGTYYVMTIFYVGGDINNTVNVGTDNVHLTHSGNNCIVSNIGVWTAQAAFDTIFYIYGKSVA